MAETRRRYRITLAADKDKSKQPQGTIERTLTDVQAERIRRAVDRPSARITSIEPVEEG